MAIAWFKDGIMLISSRRITIETVWEAHYLTIKSAKLEDAGNYEVRVKDIGRSISSSKIEVQTEEMEKHRMHCEGLISK